MVATRIADIGFFHTVVASYVAVFFLYVVPNYFRDNVHMWDAIIETLGGGSLKRAFANGVLVMHLLIWGVCNGTLLLCYWLQLPLIEQFKTQANTPWEFMNPSALRRADFSALVKSAFPLIACNNATFTYALSLLMFERMSYRFHAFPSNSEILWQLAIFIVVEDFLCYWNHRDLHVSWLYKRFHKVHHSFKNTVGVASEYAHPVEFALSNVLPFVMGPSLVGDVHFFTLLMWAVVRIGKTSQAHSGYSFPFSPFNLLPFANPAAAHDLHHSKDFNGCYGSFLTVWDSLCGTDGMLLQVEERR